MPSRLIGLFLHAWLYLSPSEALASEQLTTIDNPGGGRVIYGSVQRQTSEAGAMGAVLRSVHQQCGDRPQVGRLFHVNGTNSVAVFFTAIKHTENDKPLAGMVIVAKTGPDQVVSKSNGSLLWRWHACVTADSALLYVIVNCCCSLQHYAEYAFHQQW